MSDYTTHLARVKILASSAVLDAQAHVALSAVLARITALEAALTDLCHIPALKVDTMTWLTWDDGQEAAAAGKDLLANPYDPRTPVYAVWVQGWKHGMDEQARKALTP